MTSDNDPFDPDDPRLRFRIIVDGRVVHEAWIDTSTTEASGVAQQLAEQHADLCVDAEQVGGVWLLEVFDPAVPPGESGRYKLGLRVQ